MVIYLLCWFNSLFISVCEKTPVLNIPGKARTINIMCLLSVSHPLVISSHLLYYDVCLCTLSSYSHTLTHTQTHLSGVVSTIGFSHKTSYKFNSEQVRFSWQVLNDGNEF